MRLSVGSGDPEAVTVRVFNVTLTARYEEGETRDGRTDHVALTAIQRKQRGVTETTLHVVDGRLVELEIWAGEGVRPRVDLSKLEYA